MTNDYYAITERQYGRRQRNGREENISSPLHLPLGFRPCLEAEDRTRGNALTGMRGISDGFSQLLATDDNFISSIGRASLSLQFLNRVECETWDGRDSHCNRSSVFLRQASSGLTISQATISYHSSDLSHQPTLQLIRAASRKAHCPSTDCESAQCSLVPI